MSMLFRVPSHTKPGVSYVVDMDEGRCSCPWNSYKHRQCSHIKEVSDELAQGRIPLAYLCLLYTSPSPRD